MTDPKNSPADSPLIGKLRRFSLGMGVVALMIAAGPTLLAWTGLLGSLLQGLAGGSISALTIADSSLGWFTPLRIRGIECRSDDSFDVTIEEVSTSKTLLQLLCNWQEVGEIRVVRPVAMVRVPPTNEPAASPIDVDPNSTEPGAFPKLAGSISIEEGTLTLLEGSASSLSLHAVKANLSTDGMPTALKVSASAQVAETGAPIELDAKVQLDETTLELRQVLGKLKADTLPLATLNPLLHLIGDDTVLEGQLTCDVHLEYQSEDSSLKLQGTTGVDELILRSSYLNEDTLSLRKIEGNVAAIVTAEGIMLQHSSVVCDLGALRGDGAMPWSPTAETSRRFNVTGFLDLAALSRQLPHLLAIREGTEIAGGRVDLSIQSSGDASDPLAATFTISKLDTRRDGVTNSWPRPLVASAKFHRLDARSPFPESLQIESDFLQVKGAGTAEIFDVTLQADLDLLQERLTQFLDLADTRLQGRLAARVIAADQADQSVLLRGSARAQGLVIVVSGNRLLQEEMIDLQAKARFRDRWLTAVESADAFVKSGEEELKLAVNAETSAPALETTFKGRLSATADLHRLLKRARPLTNALDGYEAQGRAKLQVETTISPAAWSYENLVLETTSLAIQSEGWNIREPQLEIKSTRGLMSPDLQSLIAEQVIVESANLRCRLPESKRTDSTWTTNGTVELDLATIQRWARLEDALDPLQGRVNGSLALKGEDGNWSLNFRGAAKEVVYGAPVDPLVHEREIALNVAVKADIPNDRATIEQLTASAPGLAVVTAGSISELATRQRLKIEGKLSYDLAALRPQIARLLGEQIAFTGKETRAFSLQGPLGSSSPEAIEFAVAMPAESRDEHEDLRGKFGFGWQAASFYGFRAGPATVDATLQDQWLRTNPIQFSLSGGTIRLAPAVHFGAESTSLFHPAGTVADRVDLTREMCDGALQYLAPILAKVVDVRGEMTLVVGDIRVPLGKMEEADFAGELTLREVVATGSPLIQELLVLTEGAPAVRLAPDSVVRFRVVRGRVYHEGLQILLPGLQVVSSGSVGFDRTLALTLDMPIPTKWIRSKQIAEELKGQTIRLPVAGTIDRPMLDQKVLQQEMARVVGRAATQRIETEINKEINKQLNGLFDRLR